MIRFLFNFILFGLLFYAISKLFPDAFSQLVNWVEALYNLIVTLGEKAVNAINEMTKPDGSAEEASAFFRLWFS